VSSGCEATLLCWDTGMTKRKLDSSLVLMGGRKQGESIDIYYEKNHRNSVYILTNSEIKKNFSGTP